MATRTGEPLVEALEPLGEVARRAPELEPVPTGVPGLDDLFFTTDFEGDRPVQRPLGGIPRYAVIHIAGVPDTGKSLMAEQFTVEQARRGETVAFVTLESPGPFVAMGIRHRARAMGADLSQVERHVVLLDGATHTSLAHDLPTLLNTLAFAIKTYGVRHVVVDSVTGLYEAREMLARDVIRPLFNFLKKWRQTALLVSQKRSGHEALTAEAAGGYAVGHIVDGTIVLAKATVTGHQTARVYRAPIGETVRLIRVDGCRLCGHDTGTHLLEITPEGLVRVGPRLSEASEE